MQEEEISKGKGKYKSDEEMARQKYSPKREHRRDYYDTFPYNIVFKTVEDNPHRDDMFQSPAAWKVVKNKCRIEVAAAEAHFTKVG